MATRTFLQMVNDVLRELREPEVATWDESDYSTLIGTFINRAKRNVEAAWQWHSRRQTFTVNTVAATVSYAFTGTDERAQVLDAWNYTVGNELEQKSIRSMNEVYFGAGGSGVQTGSAAYFIPNGTDGTGQTQVDIYPVPTTAEVLKFNVYAPQLDFDADADECEIPYRPIVDTALARARGERGEDGGISTSEEFAFAVQVAGDAIAIDAAKHPDTVQWEPI
jgi:hypothetical protein